jgi:hypothetical protein
MQALCNLEMFQNLRLLYMTAVDGDDRKDFAIKYITQCICDRFVEYHAEVSLCLAVPLGEGDTRPLVRHLRMLSFYVCALAEGEMRMRGTIQINILQDHHRCLVKVGNESLELVLGTLDNLFPREPKKHNERVQHAMVHLGSWEGETSDLSELSQILDYNFAKTLHP